MLRHQSNQRLYNIVRLVKMIALGIVVLALAGCGSQQAAEPAVIAAKQPEVPLTNVSEEQPAVTPIEEDEQPAAEPVSTSPLSVTKTENIVYARRSHPSEHEWLLDEYTPTEPGDWPIVIFLAGRSGGKGGRTGLMQTLAEQGATVFEVGYPGMTHKTAVENNARGYRDMTEAAACALRLANARASVLGNDKPFITFVGFSLGGGIGSYLALVEDNLESRWDAYAVSKGGQPLSHIKCEANDPIHVDAFVGIGGAYDAFIGSDGKLGREAWLKAQDHDLWEMFNTAIGENPDLKIRLLHGKLDVIVVPEIAAALEATLAEIGYDVDLMQYSTGHNVPSELTIQTIVDVSRNDFHQ